VLRLIVAQGERELADAQRVRARVYCGEEGLLPPDIAIDGRERDARDYAASTLHLLVYSDAEPVGTVRLSLAPEPSAAASADFGFDLESTFALHGFNRQTMRLAEITRYCVIRRMRGTRVAPALFAALRANSRRLGITHWVAAANMETDCAEDAAIAHRVSAYFAASARGCIVPAAARRFVYTPEERALADHGKLSALKLPRVLSLFAEKLGARYLGTPSYDPHFGVFAVPLVVDVHANTSEATSRSLAGDDLCTADQRSRYETG
jgi:L-ornithine Nalpha-acyltransferase